MAEVVVMQPHVFQGTEYSSDVAWEAGATSVVALGLMSDQDLANAALTMDVVIEESYDGGNNFQSSGAVAFWEGGQVSPITGEVVVPREERSFENSSPPTHVRVRLDSPQPVSCGVKLVFSN